MNYENKICKEVAETLVSRGYVERMDNFTLDAMHHALEASGTYFEDVVWFRKTVRRYMKNDPCFID